MEYPNGISVMNNVLMFMKHKKMYKKYEIKINNLQLLAFFSFELKRTVMRKHQADGN